MIALAVSIALLAAGMALVGVLLWRALQQQRQILALLGVEVQLQAVEAKQAKQRHAWHHKVSPPTLSEDGLWSGSCSCGFEAMPTDSATTVLDQLEAHKRSMPRRMSA